MDEEGRKDEDMAIKSKMKVEKRGECGNGVARNSGMSGLPPSRERVEETSVNVLQGNDHWHERGCGEGGIESES
ncbi:unnamed protein product [Gadus morhua 'NCC']